MSLTLDFLLPPPPASYKADQPYVVHNKLSATTDRLIEPVGRHFLAHARRKTHNRTFSEDERHQAEEKANQVVEEEKVDFEFEDVDINTVNQDPTQWKSQDNYAILGLTQLRYKATEEQIKKAHRRMVLLHHPDKKADKNDDAFFKCIAKAYDTLMNPVTRRQYDSVDFGMAYLEEDVPTAKTKGDFYELWRPVFEREARFSNKQPVPSIGDANSSREEVEGFYDFFYNFDSWRTFEWLDKEGAEGSDNRDDKRYQEKKNRAQRAQLKKEDNARLRKLVDTCLGMDPRIAIFKAEEKKRRNAKKNARAEAEKAAAEAAAKKAEEERIAAEKAAAEAKAASAEAKKAKEKAKKNIRKEKKNMRTILQENNYALPAGAAPATPQEVDAQLIKLDDIFAKHTTLEALVALRESFEKAVAENKLNEVFVAAL
ncbi:DnaJ domain-containing protein [Cokeromyces recurvatus]|uniref:DnaJ domain-containing protein n=1 Tax=Cokeromyces recurvatus TaxID=90255 RepID=UPI00221E70EA|nr:DnaJ domain-containing protein [Cokeromyces recurvatus]KAI7907277.1 DnaJ domain-containing protein [Cokeromyces recurvatus]